MYSLYEKPMCPNRLIQKTSALADDSIRASLTQDCSLDLQTEEKQVILSQYAQKLINSGHSILSSQFILLHGVTKFVKLLRRSKLPTDITEFKPLHCDRNYDLFNRKLKKLVAKTMWYDDVMEKNSPSWRSTLPKEWLGDKPVQVKVHGLKYSTLLQVSNSKGGRLIKS